MEGPGKRAASKVFIALMALGALGLFARLYFSAKQSPPPAVPVSQDSWQSDPKYLQPMLGGTPRTEAEKRADEDFVEASVKSAGNRELAAVQYGKMGWDAYKKKDYKASMGRFNQAWLLNPDYAEPYWAFGLMVGNQGNIDGSIALLKRSSALMPDQPKKARFLCDLAYAYHIKGDPVEPKAAREKIYAEALDCYRAAEKLDPNLSLLYSHWAMLLFKQEKFKDAWQMAAKSKKLGGEDLDPDFVKAVEGEAGKPLPKI